MQGTFKKNLNGNMENSFNLVGGSHHYRQNSVFCWQHKEEGDKPLGNPEGEGIQATSSGTDRVGTFANDLSQF